MSMSQTQEVYIIPQIKGENDSLRRDLVLKLYNLTKIYIFLQKLLCALQQIFSPISLPEKGFQGLAASCFISF